jgi:hypothetical protein
VSRIIIELTLGTEALTDLIASFTDPVDGVTGRCVGVSSGARALVEFTGPRRELVRILALAHHVDDGGDRDVLRHFTNEVLRIEDDDYVVTRRPEIENATHGRFDHRWVQYPDRRR